MHRCAKAPLITSQQWARIIFSDNIIMKTTGAAAATAAARPPVRPRRRQCGGMSRKGWSQLYSFLVRVERTTQPFDSSTGFFGEHKPLPSGSTPSPLVVVLLIIIVIVIIIIITYYYYYYVLSTIRREIGFRKITLTASHLYGTVTVRKQ